MAPATDMESIPTLSLTTAVNVTVCVLALVFNATVVVFALYEVIVGAWSSPFVIDIVTLSVAVFPAASLIVIPTLSVLEPKL